METPSPKTTIETLKWYINEKKTRKEKTISGKFVRREGELMYTI